jgi:SAM-dependent methyltransferase
MPSSQSDWDAKYKVAGDAPAAPASIVLELLPLLPHGPALDLACGAGRHALLLGSRGQHVTAVDWSRAGLDILQTRAQAAKIPVDSIPFPSIDQRKFTAHSGIDIVRADLEQVRLPEQSFDVILCVQYLQRSLFFAISKALRPGGVLLFETFTRAQLEFVGGPRHPEHLLETGELRRAFPHLHVVFYRELRAGQGIASLLAQKPQ